MIHWENNEQIIFSLEMKWDHHIWGLDTYCSYSEHVFFLNAEGTGVDISSYKECCTCVICSLIVARLARIFKSVYSVVYRVCQLQKSFSATEEIYSWQVKTSLLTSLLQKQTVDWFTDDEDHKKTVCQSALMVSFHISLN